MTIRSPRRSNLRDRTRAFTLLEVALIVAIIGMMLLIVVGYLLAPKDPGPLPPVAATTPVPPSSTSLSAKPTPTILSVPAAEETPPSTPAATVIPVPAAPPAANPSPGLDVVPAAPAGSTPAPLPAFR